MIDPKASGTASGSSPAIYLEDVTVERGETRILDRVNWSLPRGALCVILGPNGSGKTTLMRVVTGYEWPTRGVVEVLGGRLGQIDVRAMRRRVVTVDPAMRYGVDGNLTTLHAAATGYFGTLYLYDQPSSEQLEHAAHLLGTVGLSHRKGHKFGVLSTGEQRRCLLARAMVKMPEILILDEPTAGLDVNAREHLLATVAKLRATAGSPTMIMVTHHVEEIGPATDQVAMLKGGRIVAAGRPEAVITPEQLSDLMDCKVFVENRGGRWWLEVLPEAWQDLLAGRRPFLAPREGE